MDGTELANSGDQPALNFLNTRSQPWGEPIELLATGETFLDWLVSTELIDGAERGRLVKKFAVDELDQVASEARGLREWLRGEICSWARSEGSPAVPSATGERLNSILATDSQYVQLGTAGDGVPELQVRRRWDIAAQLLVLPVAAAADLFANGDRQLVRVCDGHGCDIWFYDRTKSHRRRWCSQAVCGNRDKVKNYRARAQAASS